MMALRIRYIDPHFAAFLLIAYKFGNGCPLLNRICYRIRFVVLNVVSSFLHFEFRFSDFADTQFCRYLHICISPTLEFRFH